MRIEKTVGETTVYSDWFSYLQVDFVYPGWRLKDSAISYKYDLDPLDLPEDEDEDDAEAAFDAARSTWNNACGVSLGYDGASTSYIDWDYCPWATAINILSMDVNYNILTSKISLGTQHNWSATTPGPGEYDVESIVLHELGHTLHLYHLHGYYGDGDKTMHHYPVGTGSSDRTLHSDDIRGATWIHGE